MLEKSISFTKKLLRKAIYTIKEDEIADLKANLITLKVRIDQLEKENKKENLLVDGTKEENSWAMIVTGKQKKNENQLNLLIATTNESKEQNQKANNIIVFGIKNSEAQSVQEKDVEDQNKINGIFDQIKISKEKIKKIIRLKTKNETRPAPIIIILKHKDDRNAILKATRNISKETEEKIYFNADLTEAQQANLKWQIQERNKKNEANKDKSFYNGIRNDKKVKIAIQSQIYPSEISIFSKVATNQIEYDNSPEQVRSNLNKLTNTNKF